MTKVVPIEEPAHDYSSRAYAREGAQGPCSLNCGWAGVTNAALPVVVDLDRDKALHEKAQAMMSERKVGELITAMREHAALPQMQVDVASLCDLSEHLYRILLPFPERELPLVLMFRSHGRNQAVMHSAS